MRLMLLSLVLLLGLGPTTGAADYLKPVEGDFVLKGFRFGIPFDHKNRPITQTAGVPFRVTIDAVDPADNLVRGFSGTVSLKGADMALPGDSVEVELEFTKPVALYGKQRFALREGGRTVGAGSVSAVLA